MSPLPRTPRRATRPSFTAAVLTALLAIVSLPAPAATLRARSDAEEIAAADRIVRGRIESVRTERREGTGTIETIARVRVVDDYTGAGDRVIEIRELGGTVGDTTLHVPGAARFIQGDDILALVERTGGGYRPSAMARSVYGVRETVAGAELVRQDVGAVVVGAPGPARRSLAAFADAVRRVKQRGPVRLSAPGADLPASAALEIGQPTVESFKLLGNMRWHEADAGTPVIWYRNTLTPSPLDAGNSDTEIGQAMTAWTTPSGASISLAYGGTTLAAATSLLSCGAPPTPGGGLITYEDPDDDITTSGVIAIGGACSSGTTKTVNGTVFSKITYGFVIFTTKAEMPQLGTSLFLSRVATHEIGHAIGLGHTPTDGTVASATSNIMYPSCCQSVTPVPPAVGPDDLAGVEFIYPASSSNTDTCAYDVTPTTQSVTSGGGAVSPFTVTTAGSCTWSVASPPSWLTLNGPTTRTGSGTVSFTASANAGVARTASMTIAGKAATVTQGAAATPPSTTDADNDGLPDAWEVQAGLNPNVGTGADGGAGDPDGDGLSNLQEYQRRLHPLGLIQRYLAEGVQSDFFSTRIALVNPSTTVSAYVQLRFASPPDDAGVVVTREQWVTIAPRRRATIDAGTVAGVSGSFATTIESSALVVADRTVSWDGSGYGSHAESATESPRSTWYFAEGATMAGFNTFYLLLNPGTSPADVTVTYLRAGRAPRTKTYEVPAGARQTVWVDMERWEDGDSLEAAEVSARIDATAPIIAERAMYLDRDGQVFTAGHDSVGLVAPATRWLLAEGATGDWFDLFILLANPSTQTADVRLRFLLGDGTVIEHRERVPALSRATVWVDALGRDPARIAANPAYARLADTAVSTDVIVDNGVGVLVERSMWWPGDASTWTEAHNSGGVTESATRWALAEGEVGGTRNTKTYVLVSNPTDSAATIAVTMLSETQAPETQTFTVGANSRFNIALGEAGAFPNAVGRRVGLLVESTGVPVVVERAMYSDAGGQQWAAGTNAVATRLP